MGVTDCRLNQLTDELGSSAARMPTWLNTSPVGIFSTAAQAADRYEAHGDCTRAKAELPTMAPHPSDAPVWIVTQEGTFLLPVTGKLTTATLIALIQAATAGDEPRG